MGGECYRTAASRPSPSHLYWWSACPTIRSRGTVLDFRVHGRSTIPKVKCFFGYMLYKYYTITFVLRKYIYCLCMHLSAPRQSRYILCMYIFGASTKMEYIIYVYFGAAKRSNPRNYYAYCGPDWIHTFRVYKETEPREIQAFYQESIPSTPAISESEVKWTTEGNSTTLQWGRLILDEYISRGRHCQSGVYQVDGD